VKTEAFKAWLEKEGAEVLAPTNQYEVVRFRARGGVHVVYWGKRGLTFGPFAQECYEAFQRGQHFDMGLRGTQREGMAKFRHALFERDGRGCFYCLNLMTDEDASVEHLVARHKGGPNHMDNLALAHRTCNAKVGNLPLVKKLAVREAAIAALAIKQYQDELQDPEAD
jgi:hypothetical protein